MEYQEGQSLIEVLVVLGMVILMVTGLIAGTTTSLRGSQASRVRSTATRLAQEGLELARRTRDVNWTRFSIRSGMYCILPDNTLSDTVVTAESQCEEFVLEHTGFRRTLVFTWNSSSTPEQMSVVSRASWSDGEQTRFIEFPTYLTKWR